MKMIGNVSDWLSYAGGALIKVADSAGSTVYLFAKLCNIFDEVFLCFVLFWFGLFFLLMAL